MILVTDPMGSCSSGFSPTRYLLLLASASDQALASISGGSDSCAPRAPSVVPAWASANDPAPGTSSSASVIKTSVTAVFGCSILMGLILVLIDLFLSTVSEREPYALVGACALLPIAPPMVPRTLRPDRPDGFIGPVKPSCSSTADPYCRTNRAYPVSRFVNSPSNDEPACVEPVS